MISRDEDLFVRALAALPAVAPDPTRADQLRARCRARLEHPPHRLSTHIEPATVGGLGVMYAWQIVKLVVR